MRAPDWIGKLPVAHRGLHDVLAGRIENTLSAVRAAAILRPGRPATCRVTMRVGLAWSVHRRTAAGRAPGHERLTPRR